MEKKKNYVYLFFELKEHDDHGISEPDSKYYKCWHGARQTFKISKTMKASVKSESDLIHIICHLYWNWVDMVNHLKSKFPSMYQLYDSLQSRDPLPTPFEVKIALASKDITQDEINSHLKSLKIPASSGTIQGAFDRQTTVREPLIYMHTSFDRFYR